MVQFVQNTSLLARFYDESRRVVSEGEGACSPLFRVRSHLPLRGKQGWMTPRVGVKTTLTNGNAPLGALVPKQGPHFLPRVTSALRPWAARETANS
jgi:hypothetical protein